MIPVGVQVFVASAPIDMRFSFDRLAGLCQDQLGYDARSGALFVFFGKRRDALKVLFFDGSGMCVFYKRLDKGRFRVPEPAALGGFADHGQLLDPPRLAKPVAAGDQIVHGLRTKLGESMDVQVFATADDGQFAEIRRHAIAFAQRFQRPQPGVFVIDVAR